MSCFQLDAFWKSIFCKQTEAEGKGKKVLVDIVATAFIYMTPEAGKEVEETHSSLFS
jgi:hypothetical protein